MEATPNRGKQEPRIVLASAALTMLHLGRELACLPEAGIDELLFMIGDGEAAPFMSGMDLLREATAAAPVPCHALLFAQRPERHIARLAEAGCAGVTVPAEECVHTHRVLRQIRDAGMQAGLSLNPATSLISLDYLLEGMDRLWLLSDEPGGFDVQAPAYVLERVRMAAQNIAYRELPVQLGLCGDYGVELLAAAVPLGVHLVMAGPGLRAADKSDNLVETVQRFKHALNAAGTAG